MRERLHSMGKFKECTVLDNSLFDDGSIECKNFQVATKDEGYIREWFQLQDIFSGKIQRLILESIGQGKRYVELDNYPTELGLIVEISWD